MKRANHLLEPISDPENLRLAFWKASKGKRYAQEVLEYGENLDTNLMRLREQIWSGQPEVGKYRFFKVYEPKERQICASAFSEQVLHHAMMNICHEHFERAQIFDSYASRKGKGTHAALERAKVFTRHSAWFLKLDVKKFFESIHHAVLKDQLARLFKDERVLDIFSQIIDSYAALPGRGLPIGNLTSQYFANHFLSGLDHFVKESLRVKKYVRYMDDMALWHDDKMELKKAFCAIRDFVEQRLECALKPELLNHARHGIPFLGYRVYPGKTSLLHGSKHRFARKMRAIEEKRQSGEWNEAACARHVLPLVAFTGHAHAKELRKKLLLPNQGQSP